jgi:O-antigen ligase
MRFPATPSAHTIPATALERATSGDRLLQRLAVAVMLLEVVVFIEPAPVDGLIMVGLVAGFLSGKLNFTEVGSAPLCFLSIFGLANLISLYDAFDPIRAIAYVAITLYLIGSWLFFTGLIGRYGKRLVIILIDSYCFAGVLSALLGAGGYFHVLPFEQQLLLNGRARGLFKDCNVYGPFFVPMALFAVMRISRPGATVRSKLWQAVVISSAGLGMLLSFSRACWANCGVALIVFLAGQALIRPPRERNRWLIRATGLALAAALAMALLLNVPVVHKMLVVRANSNHLQDYDRVRFATQAIALESAQERPLGIGPGQSEAVFSYATHSVYLRILSENGVLALLAIIAFIVTTMARCVTMIRRAADPWVRDLNLAILACIAGHLVNSFVIDTVHWRSIWFIYALPWVAARLRLRLHPMQALALRRSAMSGVSSPQWARA